MFKDMEYHLQNCKECNLAGAKKTQSQNDIIATKRTELWQADLIGRIMDMNGKN